MHGSHKTGMNVSNRKWLKMYKTGKKSGATPIHGENLTVFRKIKLSYVYILQRTENPLSQ